MLFRLAYISTRTEGVDDTDVVDEIAIPSMSKNRRLDVTGCLWFSTDRFLQVLEGEERIVRDLYTKIVADPRHCAVDLLVEESVLSRRFERFSLRVIRADGPESIQSLLREHSKRQGTQAHELSPVDEFAQLVHRVIDDLSSWAMDPPERPQPSLA